MIDVLCIGTPHIVGDALGPLVGSMLKTHELKEDVQIIGCLEEPVTTTTYFEMIKRLRDDALVIVVDATLGTEAMTFDIVEKPTKPGASLNSGIEPVGNISVRAYTGSTVHEIVSADSWEVTMLAYKITYRLMDLISFNKNKDIYRYI